MSQKRVRYTINDVNNNRFYQLNKFLFEGEFKQLSNDDRVLYSILKDRHELSVANGWVNDKGEVYLIYTREEMADMLGCSLPTARKAIKSLIDRGLIEEERVGFNKPNRIFLTAVVIENKGQKKFFSPEGKNLSLQREKTFQSGEKKSFSLEGKNLSPNDTDINNTDFIDTEKSINSIIEELYDERLLKNNSMENDSAVAIDSSIDDLSGFQELIAKAELQYCYDPNAASQALRLLYFNSHPLKINNMEIPCHQVKQDLMKHLNIESLNNAFDDFFIQAKQQIFRNPIGYLSVCIYNSLWDSELKLKARMEYDGLKSFSPG